MNCPTCGHRMVHFKYKTVNGSVVESWRCFHLVTHARIKDNPKRNMGGKREGAGRKPRRKDG